MTGTRADHVANPWVLASDRARPWRRPSLRSRPDPLATPVIELEARRPVLVKPQRGAGSPLLVVQGEPRRAVRRVRAELDAGRSARVIEHEMGAAVPLDAQLAPDRPARQPE